MTRRPLIGALAALASLALSSCISLFPKEEPAQLYRFEDLASAPAPPPPAATPVSVRLGLTSFDRASAGDRILTLRGGEAAYLAQARWVEPASALFDEAVQTAFLRLGGPVVLLSRGEPRPANAHLLLDVRTFEVRLGAPGAAPTVVVEVQAVMAGSHGAASRRERVFHAEAPASADRVEPIVAAYSTAVTDVVGQIASWADTPAA